jgi:hypothetical protein
MLLTKPAVQLEMMRTATKVAAAPTKMAKVVEFKFAGASEDDVLGEPDPIGAASASQTWHDLQTNGKNGEQVAVIDQLRGGLGETRMASLTGTTTAFEPNK